MLRLKRSRKKNVNIVKKIWQLVLPYHRNFYGILLVTTLFETVRMGGPYLFGKILDLLIKTNGLLTFQLAAAVIGGLIAVRFISLVIDYLTDFIIERTLYYTERHISTTSFNKLLALSLDYHEKEKTGTKINIVNKGKDKLIDLLAYYAWEFQPIIIQLVVTAIIMAFISWIFALVFVVSLFPFILITIQTHKATHKLREKRHDLYELSSGEIGDTLTNITVVKAFAQERREESSFKGLWDMVLGISWREYRTHTFAALFKSFTVEFFYIALLVIGIIEIRYGLITVGSLVFLITLVERAYSHVYRLGRIYERAADAAEPVDRVSSLMAKTPTIKNDPEAIDPGEIRGKIAFKHITFAYKKKRVLKNVSFTIPAGSFAALVGKSGSGKSTIAKLLSRYYDPAKGSIVIDGRYNLRELDIDAYRNQTAVVFQDSPVPDRKIWEVISYSAGKVPFYTVKERVLEAAKLAHADEFIDELEDSYYTQIGERGVKLSGGQKQRLAIARALFARPKILIMDEPTSHLDTVSEAKIQQALEEISKKRAMTKIIIAHRLSTVQKADQILVLEKGKLVEHGTHKQLLAKNGVYSEIVRQSELKT